MYIKLPLISFTILLARFYSTNENTTIHLQEGQQYPGKHIKRAQSNAEREPFKFAYIRKDRPGATPQQSIKSL